MDHGRWRPRAAGTTLASAVLALGAPAVAPAAITINDVRVTETDAASIATFTLTRTAPLLSMPTEVTYRTVDGLARAPDDYGAAQGALTFPAAPLGGTQIQSVSLTVVGDDVPEPDETFALAVAGAEITDPTGVASIADDDAPAVVLPPPGSPPAQAGPAAPTGPLRFAVGSPRLRRPASALMPIACPADAGRCAGTVTLRGRANRRSKIPELRRDRTFGRRAFSLSGGGSRTLTLALRRVDRRLLERAGRVRVRVTARVIDTAGRRATVTRSGTLIARLAHSSGR